MGKHSLSLTTISQPCHGSWEDNDRMTPVAYVEKMTLFRASRASKDVIIVLCAFAPRTANQHLQSVTWGMFGVQSLVLSLNPTQLSYILG